MKRLHYAWVILMVIFISSVLGGGIRMAYGSFIRPWEMEFSVDRAATSAVATFGFVVYGLLQPFAGRWADRRGPGGVLAIGFIAMAAGLLLGRMAGSIWMVGLAWGALGSVAAAAGSGVTASVVVARWFHDRRGLAMAIMTLIGSVGAMTMTPAAIFLNDAIGWRETFLIFGIVNLLVAPVVWWIVKPSPAAMGLLPYGATEEVAAAGPQPQQTGGRASVKQVLAAPGFWSLALPFMICGVTTTGMIDTHMIPFAHEHHLPQGATAAAVALLAACNSIGIIGAGYLTDRISRRHILMVIYAVRAVSLVFLMTVHSPLALMIFAVIFGLADFSTVPSTSSLAAEVAGPGNVGLVFGLISLAHQLGSALGAFVPGLMHSMTGSYQSSFMMGAALLVVASVLSLRAGKPAAKAGVMQAS